MPEEDTEKTTGEHNSKECGCEKDCKLEDCQERDSIGTKDVFSTKEENSAEKVTRFMKMEYHGTWWTEVEHNDFRTKTYVHQPA
eukprot:1484020-Amphidinium_carterae.1